MNEMLFGYDRAYNLIESLKNQVRLLSAQIEIADNNRKASIRAEKIAKSVLNNTTLSDKDKLEILEFVFLTNK